MVGPRSLLRTRAKLTPVGLLLFLGTVGLGGAVAGAWGAPGLTEYNPGTDDPHAVEEFLTEYEYWWNLARSVENTMGHDDVLAAVRGK